MFDNVTLASLLTIPGAAIAALIVGMVVKLIQANGVGEGASQPLLATVISAALYTLAYLGVAVYTADAFFLAFICWLLCATSAVGIQATASHVATVAREERTQPPG